MVDKLLTTIHYVNISNYIQLKGRIYTEEQRSRFELKRDLCILNSLKRNP